MLRRLWLLAIACCIANLSNADPQNSSYIPPDLNPWVSWVSSRHPEWECARTGGGYECVWPGVLNYQISESGATFTLQVEVLAKASVPLPSAESSFPQNITIRDSSGNLVVAPTEITESGLTVRLPAGTFQITGELNWQDLPSEIPVPSRYGIVNINSNQSLGTIRPKRDENSIWLERPDAGVATDSVTVNVRRQITDGSPAEINTLIRLNVSGKPRALDIGQVIPLGAVPVSIDSTLPHHLSATGILGIQVVPGSYDISVLSILSTPLTSIHLPQPSPIWPKQEIWSWLEEPSFRSVELSGGQGIHDEGLDLPEEFKKGALYAVDAGGEIKLTELRRGEESPPPDEINLKRSLWIDLNGEGFTVQDLFSGNLSRSTRLNALSDTKIGRVTISGEPQLVTTDPAKNLAGVELRDQALSLETTSRLGSSSKISAVGWDAEVNTLQGELNLPPSYTLLHISGTDVVTDSWIGSWSLLHIFLGILIVISALRIFGPFIATLLAISLVINHQEFLAPRMLFIHLMILLVWRNLISKPNSIWGMLSRSLLAITFLGWALQVLAFSKLQFTQLLYPQLQAGTRYRTFLQELLLSLENSLISWPILLTILALSILGLRWITKASGVWRAILRVVVCGVIAPFIVVAAISLNGLMGIFSSPINDGYYAKSASSLPYRTDTLGGATSSELAPQPVAKVEQDFQSDLRTHTLLSGPAIPTWRWHTHNFEVSGPVGPEHTIRFYFLPPTLSRIVCALRVLAILSLLVLVFRKLGYASRRFMKVPTATAMILLAVGSLLHSSSALAETPNTELLKELEQRLLDKTCQRDSCTTIHDLSISLTPKEIKLSLQVVSDGRGGVIIPGPLDVFSPTNVHVNGKPSIALRRTDENFLEIRTEPGMNTIEIGGELVDQNAFALQFKQKSLAVKINSTDWYVEGLLPSGYVADSLRFTKQSKEIKEGKSQPIQHQHQLPSWAVVKRSIRIGEERSIVTTVKGIGIQSGPTQFKIPQLDKEQITSGNVNVEGTDVILTVDDENDEVSYSSTIPSTSELTLTSATRSMVSEEWVVSCDSTVSCSFSGITPTNSIVDGRHQWLWDPYPNESVNIKITPLASISGDFMTVDQIQHTVHWGTNLLEGNITVNARTTKQSRLSVTIPEGAEIRGVVLDNEPGREASTGTENTAVLQPGSHSMTVTYQLPWAPKMIETMPQISLNTPVHNATFEVQPSPDRWLLWTGGLPWGPCVVFWSKLILICILCWFIRGWGLLPVGPLGSIFLGIGLATMPLITIFIPMAWLIFLKLNTEYTNELNKIHRLIRLFGFIGLSVLALLAFYSIVELGLVLEPPMLIAGNSSSALSLRWFIDHTSSPLPQPWVISAPLWCWRAFALVWSTWLALALLSWLRRSVDYLKSEFAES